MVTRCWAGWSPDSGRSIFEPRPPLAISAINATRSMVESEGDTDWLESKLATLRQSVRVFFRGLDVERRIGFGDLTARVWFGLGPPPVRRLHRRDELIPQPVKA